VSKDYKVKPPQRVAIFWQIVVAILVFIYFELGYLWSGSGHGPYDSINASFAIDEAIPLVPFFIVFYMLGYLFVFLPCFLLKEKSEFFWGVVTFILMLSVSFLIFKYYPVHMYKTYAIGTDGFSKLTYFQQKADVSYNNCPSLHVALNLFSWLILLHRWPKVVVWIIPLPILIILSTLFVKQHLFVDVMGGICVALFGYFFWRALVKYLRDYATIGFGVCLVLIVSILIMSHRQLSLVGRIVSSFVGNAYHSMPIITVSVLTAIIVAICIGILIEIFRFYKSVSLRFVKQN
jgi:membrane-associated phospholipid phosphatase